jgi:hypothetical protein
LLAIVSGYCVCFDGFYGVACSEVISDPTADLGTLAAGFGASSCSAHSPHILTRTPRAHPRGESAAAAGPGAEGGPSPLAGAGAAYRMRRDALVYEKLASNRFVNAVQVRFSARTRTFHSEAR